jgi:hypothetical protein
MAIAQAQKELQIRIEQNEKFLRELMEQKRFRSMSHHHLLSLPQNPNCCLTLHLLMFPHQGKLQ